MRGRKDQFNFQYHVLLLDDYPRLSSDRDDHHEYYYPKEYLQLLTVSSLNILNNSNTDLIQCCFMVERMVVSESIF